MFQFSRLDLFFFLGFFSAVEFLNQLPPDVLAELCHQVIAFLQFSKGLVSATQFLDVRLANH